MKKKWLIIIGIIILLITVAALVFFYFAPKWSELSYEAIVQETVTTSDGEVRLIVQRTTEIYGDPLNSLCISEDTVLCDTNGTEIHLEDFHPGDAVKVTLKDAFNEEKPFYYPTVYEIRFIEASEGR